MAETPYYAAGVFPASGELGFRWPAPMPDAPMRVRSVSAWVRGPSGEAIGGASIKYIDGTNIVLKGPAGQKFRFVIVLSDRREGDWDAVSLSLKDGDALEKGPD